MERAMTEELQGIVFGCFDYFVLGFLFFFSFYYFKATF